jgi:hypothetical protein
MCLNRPTPQGELHWRCIPIHLFSLLRPPVPLTLHLLSSHRCPNLPNASETLRLSHGKPFLRPLVCPIPIFSHQLLTTTKDDAGGSGTHKEAGKSDVDGWHNGVQPSPASVNIDLEAQAGTMSVPGKPFHRLPCPPFQWSLSHIVCHFKGEGSNGKASGIPPSGNVWHEGAGQANADHAPDPGMYVTCHLRVLMI